MDELGAEFGGVPCLLGEFVEENVGVLGFGVAGFGILLQGAAHVVIDELVAIVAVLVEFLGL